MKAKMQAPIAVRGVGGVGLRRAPGDLLDGGRAVGDELCRLGELRGRGDHDGLVLARAQRQRALQLLARDGDLQRLAVQAVHLHTAQTKHS